MQEKLRELPVELLSLADFPLLRAVEEDLPDLEGNAIKKARYVSRETGHWALSDDTGLEVDALEGRPGVLSARYSGEGATYNSNCLKLLADMAGVPHGLRRADFRTVMCLAKPDGLHCVEGKLGGSIGSAMRGVHGFGYDPVFVLADGRTLAELDLAEKNAVSHRGRALKKMTDLIKYLLQD